jgi:hypothetical protein
LTKDVERLASKVAELERRDAEMAERLARLEESRSTLKAEVGQEISQVIADIRVRFAEQEAQRTLTVERALIEIRNELKSLEAGSTRSEA